MSSMDEPALGSLLRTWRERALLTQDQLATEAGLNVRTVRRLEAGQLRRPRGTSIRLLAEAMGLDDRELAILTRAAHGPTPSPDQRPTTPRQLPADVAAFVGRADELTLLDQVGNAGATAIVAIDGMPGVGKTALAVHAAHQLAPRFPDGDLFIDLHGYTQGMVPADPADTLARVLEILGVPGESIPRHLDDRAALYRSIMASRKMLIVLDNAVDEAQVRPLLPGVGGCLALITSRRRLLGLDGARTMSVDVLPLTDAIALFSRTAGSERVADLPDGTLGEVVRRCGLLPLAIRLAAARLKAHPAWNATHVLDRLEAHRRRLSELQAGQRSVIAALNLSYRGLADKERRAYRLLGLHPGADLAGGAAAALLGTTAEQAERLLDSLQEVHLLQEPVPGRYQFHDLIRAHADRWAHDEEPEPDRRAALHRLLDYYSRAASEAMDRLYPYEADTRPCHLYSGTASMPDAATAAAWLDTELANLLSLAEYAAEHAFPQHIHHLSRTLHRCLRTRSRYSEAESLLARALLAARAAADRTSEMEALLGLGEIHNSLSKHDTAITNTTNALFIAREIRHRSGELRALNGLVAIHLGWDEVERAADYVEDALSLAREIGNRTGELDALVAFGYFHRLTGQYEEGARQLKEALSIARSIGHHTSEARALIGLGYIEIMLEEFRSAADRFTLAIGLARDIRYRVGELSSLTALGELHHAHGRFEQARECFQQVADLAREVGDRNWQFEAIHNMGRIHYDCGEPDQAFTSHRQGLALALELGQPTDQVRAHDGLAHVHLALDRCDQARHHWSQALAILVTLDIDQSLERGVDVESIRTHLARLTPEGAQPATAETSPSRM